MKKLSWTLILPIRQLLSSYVHRMCQGPYLSHGIPPSHFLLATLHASHEVLRLPGPVPCLGSTGHGHVIMPQPCASSFMKINANYGKMIKSDVRTGGIVLVTVRRRILPIYLRHCNIIVKYIMDSYNLILKPAYKCGSLLGLAFERL